jgi:hypothetical protein
MKKTGEAEISDTGTPGALCSMCKAQIINKIEQGAVSVFSLPYRMDE